jgi:hypothetical protein
MKNNTTRLIAVFTGSLLLFMIQPMLGRTLLPAFGGSAAVWTVCLASYQCLLLAGYLYAHYLSKMTFNVQRKMHQLLLAGGVIWSVAVAAALPWLRGIVVQGGSPAFSVLLCVMLFVGLPYVLLAAGSTLIQSWLGQAGDENRGSVYKLYAVSNLGSFCGLFIYPFVLEPHVALGLQWWIFGGAMGVYLFLIFNFLKSFNLAGSKPQRSAPDADVNADVSAPGVVALWFIIPAVSVFTLNAVTTHLTLDVMPMPLLWVVLLGLFLLSYVIGFSDRAERNLVPLFVGALIFCGAAGFFNNVSVSKGHFKYALTASLGLVLFGALFLHSWLYSMRPHTQRLTLFYLGNALGGALGGVSASLLAPLLFDRVTEFPLALLSVTLLAVVFVLCGRRTVIQRGMLALICAIALGCVAFGMSKTGGDRDVVLLKRGFFGTLQVLKVDARTEKSVGYLHEYVHGSTVHGLQALIPGKERTPTTYFTQDGGGYAVTGHPKYRRGEPMRVNILGMGVGVMLAYARTNDYYRCYEISPEAVEIATNPDLFTFVSGCPAEVSIACEDARKGLERELAEGVEPYDVIQIDAFSGDNLPYHLSTKEAFELYFKMLKPDGILAINISNWHLDLEPFVKAVGDEFNVPMLVTRCEQDFAKLQFGATFAFYCREPRRMGEPPKGAYLRDMRRVTACKLPRDDKGSFINLIRW